MQQKGNAPEVFMKRYKDANRSLNPLAFKGPQGLKAPKKPYFCLFQVGPQRGTAQCAEHLV